jgi:hypothetical protein
VSGFVGIRRNRIYVLRTVPGAGIGFKHTRIALKVPGRPIELSLVNRQAMTKAQVYPRELVPLADVP